VALAGSSDTGSSERWPTLGVPDPRLPVSQGRMRLTTADHRRPPLAGLRFAVMGALVAIEERKKLLGDVWLFHGASDEELTSLAELAYEVTIGPHVNIVTENEFGDELFLVVDGHAAVTRSGVDLGVLNAGDFFGEMALLGTGVRTSTVRSIVTMTLLGLRAEHFDDVLASDPLVARRVLSVVVRRLEQTDRRLAELEGRPGRG
jgi:CRP-like cAMP-binding protein